MTTSSSFPGVWFPQWAEVLARARLKDIERRTYRLAIGQFLLFCRRSRQRATVEAARAFMAEVTSKRPLGISQTAAWKAGLNWFFCQAKLVKSQNMAGPPALPKPVVRSKEPPLAATDVGGPEWEQALIRRLREGNYQWRTEQAYRMWAGRFAGWLKGRGCGVAEAGEIEVREFLSDLATRQRVAVATQRQALNAILFLYRTGGARPSEGGGSEMGDGRWGLGLREGSGLRLCQMGTRITRPAEMGREVRRRKLVAARARCRARIHRDDAAECAP